jgi:hypothetical protein
MVAYKKKASINFVLLLVVQTMIHPVRATPVNQVRVIERLIMPSCIVPFIVLLYLHNLIFAFFGLFCCLSAIYCHF